MNAPRPHVLLSVAMSIDGHIDDTTPDRLLLSNPEDFARVDEVRAHCDAILIGANTIRRDNPRLLVNSESRRAARVQRGLAPYPVKITISASGDLEADLKFFHTGGEKIVYASSAACGPLRARFDGLAEVVDAGEPISLPALLDDLGRRGIKRLMVEGGGQIHTQFLTQDLADEIHLAMAPFFVGDPGAPRFINAGSFPQGPQRRMHVAETRQIGDIVLIRYLPREP
ncbi:dihydrofolate reductase family protein (plasmid) [Streptosporangium sp. NBC_01495]|uniref:RibD family protein n=1 Tax=Streptosporangium sp. NBC_01495 TaxID=2903899 RepID=UPI002E342505|nr:dihydrofolate reductase family protein [Streptosporangium sp. NBC_01495]